MVLQTLGENFQKLDSVRRLREVSVWLVSKEGKV